MGITEAWEEARLAYQFRYARLVKKIDNGQGNDFDMGAMRECSYVLINIFGLKHTEVNELERNDYCGLANRDFEDERYDKL